MFLKLGGLSKSLLFHGRRYLLPFLALNVLEFLIFLSHDAHVNLYHCYLKENIYGSFWNAAYGARRLKDIMHSDGRPTSAQNIFFHETKCRSDSPHVLNLTARQACAIESAALNNPNFKVFVLFTSATYLPGIADPENPITDALLSYDNINFRQLNLWRYAENTPIENWVKNGDLFQSR